MEANGGNPPSSRKRGISNANTGFVKKTSSSKTFRSGTNGRKVREVGFVRGILSEIAGGSNFRGKRTGIGGDVFLNAGKLSSGALRRRKGEGIWCLRWEWEAKLSLTFRRRGVREKFIALMNTAQRGCTILMQENSSVGGVILHDDSNPSWIKEESLNPSLYGVLSYKKKVWYLRGGRGMSCWDRKG